jgi:HAD superfamily hydrolase (TIGR01450 family)
MMPHRRRGYPSAMLLLVDLDGVVYRGADPVPGVAAVLAERAAAGDAVVYVTNNSMHYRADYLTRLAAMGAPVSADRIVSSSRATAAYLVERRPDVRRVLVLGAGGLERELRDVGLDVVTAAHAATRMAQEGIDGADAAGRPDAVVVGLDPQLTRSTRPSAPSGLARGRSSPRSRRRRASCRSRSASRLRTCSSSPPTPPAARPATR